MSTFQGPADNPRTLPDGTTKANPVEDGTGVMRVVYQAPDAFEFVALFGRYGPNPDVRNVNLSKSVRNFGDVLDEAFNFYLRPAVSGASPGDSCALP